MHYLIVPLIIDSGFVISLLASTISEKKNVHLAADESINEFFSCPTLYMSSFALIIVFFTDALLYSTALVLNQAWGQYKHKLVFWTMYLFT